MFDEIFELKRDIDVQEEFLEFYPKWIKSSELNNFDGLESFDYKYVSLGVTQGIDDFILYCNQNNKRIRMYKGEYPYAREIIKYNILYINDSALTHNDAVIISLPFSATGDIHNEWSNLIDTCNRLEIPVFVDCAFFGTCLDISINLNSPCIDTVAFSPTKGLNCGYFRSGIIFTKRKGNDSTLKILNDWHHGIHLHTSIALELMKNFSSDTIPKIYRESQLHVCKEYGLIPSKTVHLGLNNTEWVHFSRDNIINRIGLKNAIYDYFNTNSFRK